MRNRLDGIDAFRLLAAFSVVTVHVGMPPRYYPMFSEATEATIRLAGRWAVPFFFLVTGYFLGTKNSRDRAAAPLARAALILVVASLVMLPLNLNNIGMRATLDYLSDGDVFLRGGYYHLWFLSSLVVGLLTVLVFDYFEQPRGLAWAAAVSFACYLAFGAYSPGSERGLETARHFSSVAFLYCGTQLSRRNFGLRAALLMACLGMALQGLEAICLSHLLGKPLSDYQFLIGTVPFAIGMFGIARNVGTHRVVSLLGRWGARYALGIYVVHPYALHLVGKLATLGGYEQSVAFGVVCAPASFGLSCLSLMLVERVSPICLDILQADKSAIQRLFSRGKQSETGDG
jgi:surface polysaccharide O-acyltransferase-like enzyme